MYILPANCILQNHLDTVHWTSVTVMKKFLTCRSFSSVRQLSSMINSLSVGEICAQGSMILMMSSCSRNPISVLTFRLRYSMYSTCNKVTAGFLKKSNVTVMAPDSDDGVTVGFSWCCPHLFIITHGTPGEFIQVPVCFGLSLGN